MAFCPTCRSEFRPDFDRCQDCDCDLVDSLPSPSGLAPLCTISTQKEAEGIEMFLKEKGIQVSISEVNIWSYLDLSAPPPVPPQFGKLHIMVSHDDLNKGKGFLEEYFRDRG